MIWFFFPRVFLMPVMVIAGVLYVALLFARIGVVLDRVAGEAAITLAFWTRHARLTQIERVEVLRFGVSIRVAGGDSYGFGLQWKGHWLERLPRVRTGFEGMEPAIAEAAAAERAADPGRAALEDAASRRAASRFGIPAASFVCGVGLLSLAAAAAVHPQAGGWLVHSVALLLRIYCGVGGGLCVLIGPWLLRGA